MTDEGGVLGNLPNSRPGKRSAKRGRPAGAKTAGSAKAKGGPRRTTALKSGGPGDGVRVDPDIRGEVGHDRAGERETPGHPLSAAVRTAAGLAVAGAKVAGAVTQELLRRLPRP
jgi:hypothetical protein